MSAPVLLVTVGDPLGSGPELAVKAALAESVLEVARPVVVGALSVIEDAVKRLHVAVELEVVSIGALADVQPSAPSKLSVLPIGSFELATGGAKGRPSAEAGRHTIEVARATAKLLQDGAAAAVASGPSSKASMKLAGSPYEGVGEVMTEEWGLRQHGNMLVVDRLRMLLATNHIAHAKVASALQTEKLKKTIALAEKGLREFFGVAEPRIAVAALNPHAGEGGLFGDEEARVIAPAVEAARADGIRVDGPLAADFVIPNMQAGRYDGAVMMYHDQAHVPAKALAGFKPATILVGVPHVRTSVAHGTVYGKAARGTADPRGMIYACELAAQAVRSGTARKRSASPTPPR